MTFDVRQQKSQKYVWDKFRKFFEERDDDLIVEDEMINEELMSDD